MGLQGIGNRCLSICSNAFSDELRFHENPSRFNRSFPLKGLVTTLLMLPMMLSMAVVGLFWKLLCDPNFGIINYALGLGSFEWLSDPKIALYAVALTDI